MKLRLAVLRILALIGLGISLYLLVLKLTGSITSLKGCGAGAGCENVLGSKWSQWFGIPVSVFASVLYATLFGLTFKPSVNLLRLLAFLLLGAAVWFIGLQLLVIESFCPWCCATHLVGLVSAFFLWRGFPKPKSLALTIAPAFLSLVILILGQALGPEPETSTLTEETFEDVKPVTSTKRLIDLGEGKKIILGQEPFIGPADAKHVLVKYFDYTCNGCRDLEGDLKVLLKKYPEDIAIVLSPTPLNRACNPHFPTSQKNHDHACELSRLAMAAWLAKPAAYPEVHELLFTRPVLAPQRAREEIAEIISEEELAAALKSPEIDKTIQENSEDFRQLARRTIVMPKLIVKKGKVMHGLARNAEIFVKQVETVLELQKP